jgi:hypothetical protein
MFGGFLAAERYDWRGISSKLMESRSTMSRSRVDGGDTELQPLSDVMSVILFRH